MKGNTMQTSSAPSHSTSIWGSTPTTAYPWLMLISRSVMFILFQGLIALLLAIAGAPSAWDESARWWTFSVILTNLTSIYLLNRAFQAEGKRFFDLFRFSRATWKTDLLWFAGFSVLGMPLAALPREPLAIAIFGDVETANHLMFPPLPMWAILVSFLLPLTIYFAELPTYFGYVMPRLEAQLRNGWVAWIMSSFFLAAQHMFFPFYFNGGFMLWRLGMFVPFAFFTGLVLKFRPTLLPYFVIVHALLDVSLVLVFLMI
jgi:hypothetical protein